VDQASHILYMVEIVTYIENLPGEWYYVQELRLRILKLLLTKPGNILHNTIVHNTSIHSGVALVSMETPFEIASTSN